MHYLFFFLNVQVIGPHDASLASKCPRPLKNKTRQNKGPFEQIFRLVCSEIRSKLNLQ